MGKKSSSPPPAPDPSASIAAQQQANIDVANTNAKNSAVDQFTPYGSITYRRDNKGVPTAMYQNLSDQGQRIFDQQQDIYENLTGQAMNRVQGITTDPYSTAGVAYDPSSYGDTILPTYQRSNLPYDPRAYGDVQMYADKAGDAFYNQAMSRLEPTQSQEFDRRMQWLADQGHPVGGEGWTRAYDAMAREQNDARASVANQAAQIAGQEADRRINMEQGLRSGARAEDVSDYQLESTNRANEIQTQQNLRNQILQELLTGRTQNFNEASAYLGGAQIGIPSMPAAPTYNLQGTDIIGATNAGYQNQMAAFNARQNQNASMWRGGANLAGLAMTAPQPGSLMGRK